MDETVSKYVYVATDLAFDFAQHNGLIRVTDSLLKTVMKHVIMHHTKYAQRAEEWDLEEEEQDEEQNLLLPNSGTFYCACDQCRDIAQAYQQWQHWVPESDLDRYLVQIYQSL